MIEAIEPTGRATRIRTPAPGVGRSFDLNEFLARPASRRFGARILTVCGLLAAVEGLDQYIVATTLPALAEFFRVESAAFALVFVLQALGQVIGAYGVAPMADSLGRRPVILLCTFAFGLITVLSAFASTVGQFAAARLAAFIFLGGAIPNVFAIAAEFAPSRNRQRSILALGCIHGLGAGSAGFIGARLLVFGTQAPLLICGGITLLSALLASAALPESIRFLALRTERSRELADLLRRIEPSLNLQRVEQYDLHERAEGNASVRAIFGDGRAAVTVLLWTIAALCLPILGTVGQWMPTYFHVFGNFDLPRAATINSSSAVTAVIWPLCLMLLMDRFGITRALALSYFLAFLCLLMFAWIGSYPGLAWVVALGFGAFAAGSTTGFYALCARAYPTEMRATGMGWAIGAGRLLSVFAPALGGAALARHYSTSTIAVGVAAPMLAASVCVLFVRFRRQPREARG